MSLLVSKYRQTRGKNDVGEARTAMGFKTGIDLLDYKNGKLVMPKGHKPYFSVGIEEGSYIMVIGRSGSGKSTLAIQMACNIVEPYENGAVYIDDVEAAMNMTRIKTISGWDDDMLDSKIVHRNVGITTENFYKNINDIYKLKMEMKDELTVVSDKLDSRGNPIEFLEPTVYILDSLAVLSTDSISEEEELSGQMSQTSVARANASVFRRILPKLKAANIILIVINHVMTKVDINPMIKTKAQINYLKQDETVPGGHTPLYLANNIFRVDPGSKLTEDEKFGIPGFMNKITIIKSRTNRAGQEVDCVYDQNNGFSNEYSNFNFLKDQKLVGGAGRSFYLQGAETIKFSQKGFEEKLYESPELQKAYKKLLAQSLRQFIYIPTAADIQEEQDMREQEQAFLDEDPEE